MENCTLGGPQSETVRFEKYIFFTLNSTHLKPLSLIIETCFLSESLISHSKGYNLAYLLKLTEYYFQNRNYAELEFSLKTVKCIFSIQ